MGKLFHRLLYRLLSLEGYLRVVSRLFFLNRWLGLGRTGRALEYNYHLPQLVRRGDVAIDIGANLGYYTRPLADIVGAEGKVYAPAALLCRTRFIFARPAVVTSFS